LRLPSEVRIEGTKNDSGVMDLPLSMQLQEVATIVGQQQVP
jgi:hypothetical protein